MNHHFPSHLDYCRIPKVAVLQYINYTIKKAVYSCWGMLAYWDSSLVYALCNILILSLWVFWNFNCPIISKNNIFSRMNFYYLLLTPASQNAAGGIANMGWEGKPKFSESSFLSLSLFFGVCLSNNRQRCGSEQHSLLCINYMRCLNSWKRC